MIQLDLHQFLTCVPLGYSVCSVERAPLRGPGAKMNHGPVNRPRPLCLFTVQSLSLITGCMVRDALIGKKYLQVFARTCQWQVSWQVSLTRANSLPSQAFHRSSKPGSENRESFRQHVAEQQSPCTNMLTYIPTGYSTKQVDLCSVNIGATQ